VIAASIAAQLLQVWQAAEQKQQQTNIEQTDRRDALDSPRPPGRGKAEMGVERSKYAHRS
jgi:hypothetical protein